MNTPTWPEILAAASEVSGYSTDEIAGPLGLRPLFWWRYATMHVAREITGASYPQIGRWLNRDHTTVMSGCKQVTTNPRIQEMVERVTAAAWRAANPLRCIHRCEACGDHVG